MIFVTVGSQMPFDRLVQAVDDWAGTSGAAVFAQIGRSTLQPRHLRHAQTLTPEAFREQVQACQLLVGHAGMGTVLTALEFGKPMLLMPRRGELRETRNDHQIATLNWLASKPGIYRADDAAQLQRQLQAWLERAGMPASQPALEAPALESLVGALQGFIAGD